MTAASLGVRFQASKRVLAPSPQLAPVRFIDCGEAGKIEFYTAAQIEAARKECGWTRYVTFLKHCYDAPNVARRVLDRVKAREEQIKREKRAAEEAITTKLEDLPPLPSPPLPEGER